MQLIEFEKLLKKNNAIRLNDEYLLFNDYELYSLDYKTTIKYDNLDDVVKYNTVVKELIENMNEYLLYFDAKGDPESKTGPKGSLFGGQGQDHKDNSKYDIPARMNKMYKGNKMTFDNTLKNFKKSHLLSDKEHGITVDKDGFVSVYKHGNKGSVGWTDNELAGKHVIHNHPEFGYSAFSKADLITTASTGATGITATSSKYDYVLNKKHNFDSKGFIKAVNDAGSRTGDYNKDVHKFLKDNAKKYGYSYYRKSNAKLVKK